MPYNAAVAKKAYYKLPVTTLAQLEKNMLRSSQNQNLGGSTLQAVIKYQFATYKQALEK